MDQKQTEQLIKDTAKDVFFGQGRINAKMHEIAAGAGVNRALLHYYFRNRDTLFSVVLEEALQDTFHRMFEILLMEKAFEQKVEKAIDHIMTSLARYPFMESFIISELNKAPEQASTFGTIKKARAFSRQFLPQIHAFLKKKKQKQTSPEQYLVNLMALCAYASSTKPIVQNIFGYNEKRYSGFLSERKKLVTDMVLFRQ